MRVLIALGGNALLRRGEKPDASIQLTHMREAAGGLAEAANAHRLVITHGNGPQVGLLALESSDDATLTRPYPLDSLVAETQGLLGYWLQQAIANAGLTGRIVSLVSQTVVDAADPAFTAPTKFVGAVYSEAEAVTMAHDRGWTVAADGAHWRRVVPSPVPVRIVEAPIVADLLDQGVTVICAGGGGSAVLETSEGLLGVEAVVDKDHVAALLALNLQADMLVLLTDVAAVIAGFGTPEAQPLGHITVSEVAGQEFAAGSMGPKVAAACRFASESGGTAAIGSLEDIAAVLAGTAGTHITADPARPARKSTEEQFER